MDEELKELLSEVELETKCDRCQGSGRRRVGEQSQRCFACDGEGKIVTPFGEQVLSFVRRNLRKMLAEMD